MIKTIFKYKKIVMMNIIKTIKIEVKMIIKMKIIQIQMIMKNLIAIKTIQKVITTNIIIVIKIKYV